jgi:hypothetical protein
MGTAASDDCLTEIRRRIIGAASDFSAHVLPTLVPWKRSTAMMRDPTKTAGARIADAIICSV